MQQKNLLIISMEKLISHIVVSKKNQEEIFASLSKNDFKKIISNLEDDYAKLRKISLALVSQLLYNNQQLKEKFCLTMGIPILAGRVALNNKFAHSGKGKPQSGTELIRGPKEVFSLLKQPTGQLQLNSLFWFINYDNRGQADLKLQFFNSQHTHKSMLAQLLDPLECMVGFILSDRPNTRKGKSEYEPLTTSSTRMVNNFVKPNPYKSEFKQQQPTHNFNLNLNQSVNVNVNVNLGGYMAGRDMGYGDRMQNVRIMNASHQDARLGVYTQATVEVQPQLHPMGSPIDIQNFNRSKYGGIKLMSTVTSTKNRDGRYFEENPLFTVQKTNNSRPTQYINNPVFNKATNLSGQRGYETLREKKIVEQFP